MDGSRELLYRNAQLETELRFVKEQLSQANNANQYLLNRLSGLSGSTTAGRIDQSGPLHKQYERAVRENVQLKAQMGLTPRFDPKLRISARSIKPERKDSFADTLEADSVDSDNQTDRDLLSFDEAEQSGQDTTLRPNTNCLNPIQDRIHKQDFVGLGVSNSFSSDYLTTSTEEFDAAPPIRRSPFGQQSGFNVKYADGTSAFVPTPTLTPESSFSAPPRPPRQPLRFKDYEHMRMMGMACFLEERTGAERARVWVNHAREHPRHTAAEYEEYYENVILPAYERKMEAREAKTHEMSMEAREMEAIMTETTEVEQPPTGATEMAAMEEPVAAQSNIPSNSTDDSLRTVVPVQMCQTQSASPVIGGIADFTATRGRGSTGRAPYAAGREQYFPGPQEVCDLFAGSSQPDPRARRTVIVSNIPPVTTLYEILVHIRTGKILTATLHDTAGMRTIPPTNTNTARITFVTARGAENLVTNWTSPFNTGVYHLWNASRPITGWVLEELRDRNFSRVLFIHDYLRQWSLESVEEQLMLGGAKKPLAVSYDTDAEGLMNFEFASVFEARRAWQVINANYAFFQNVSRGFAADPCAPVFGPQNGGDEADERGVQGESGSDQEVVDDGMGDEAEDRVGAAEKEGFLETEIEREEDAMMREG